MSWTKALHSQAGNQGPLKQALTYNNKNNEKQVKETIFDRKSELAFFSATIPCACDLLSSSIPKKSQISSLGNIVQKLWSKVNGEQIMASGPSSSHGLNPIQSMPVFVKSVS